MADRRPMERPTGHEQRVHFSVVEASLLNFVGPIHQMSPHHAIPAAASQQCRPLLVLLKCMSLMSSSEVEIAAVQHALMPWIVTLSDGADGSLFHCAQNCHLGTLILIRDSMSLLLELEREECCCLADWHVSCKLVYSEQNACSVNDDHLPRLNGIYHCDAWNK